jgi:transporter family-2 protein
MSTSQGLLAVVLALAAGMAITTQVTMSALAGQVIGPVRTGFMLHITGAVISAVIIAALALRGQGMGQWGFTPQVIRWVTFGGLLGLFIVAGISYALPRTGVAGGQLTVIVGQLVIALVIDSMGWGPTGAIPLDLRRIAAIVLLAAAAYLMLPKS